jgi:hypothetical protein
MAVLVASHAVTGADITRRRPDPGYRTDRQPTGRLMQMGLLITSPWVPYRVVLATLIVFPVLRYVIAPGSSLDTDLWLTAVCGASYAAIAFILTRSARR